MRKIPSKFENPLDTVIIGHIDNVQSRFYKLGVTPNILTTFSVICQLLSMYFFVNNKDYYTAYSVIFFGLSYYFDCFDGHLARSYNMVTKFGDYYDHISDLLKIIGFIVLIYIYYKSYFYISLGLIVSFGLLSMIHLSCQEHYYANSSDTMHYLKYICPTKYLNIEIGKCLSITKYVGCGTYMLVAMLLIIFLKTRPADTTSDSTNSNSNSNSNSENKYVISTSDTKN